ncbi:MAG: glycosyl hydrolase family 18 protein [Bacteroidales bacterium]|nr:glycosyl hydrolase family 18 protein [Bacteroidales bacterium]
MKTINYIIAVYAFLFSANIYSKNPSFKQDSNKLIVAYVTSWSSEIPETKYMTHINYAFGHVNESFNGVNISNEERLRDIAELKKENKNLKVLLSIGGWGSGRFSEMAADDKNRKLFAKDCKRIIKEYDIDGIDIDWEYPTSNAANISSSPEDTKNYTLLMRDIRKAIGKDNLLTLASSASAEHIDFKNILKYIDFVNIMAYDMGGAPKHHAALYESKNSGWMNSDKAVKAHIKAGIPKSMIVMGMPFYGRGAKNFDDFVDYKNIIFSKDYQQCWDENAQVPYLIDKDGELVLGYDNKRSIAIKCRYILNEDLLGGMYWDYSGDDNDGSLRKTVFEELIERKNQYNNIHKVVVITENGGQHKAFSEAAIKWLEDESKVQNMKIEIYNNPDCLSDKDFINRTDLIVQLDYPPYTWTKEAEKNFVDYINDGHGAWIGFHHATLLGEFDGYPLWKWFSNFMGGITFKNYIAPLADGEIVVEDKEHYIMKGIDKKFTLEDDEWYTYDKSPRENVHVLASVDESTYNPKSSVTMGDHPVVWINENVKAKNLYIQMGHSAKLFESSNFTHLLHNALSWVFENE